MINIGNINIDQIKWVMNFFDCFFFDSECLVFMKGLNFSVILLKILVDEIVVVIELVCN